MLEEEIREIDECDTEEFDTLDSSKKTTAILGDEWWPQAAEQEGDNNSKKFLWKQRNERPIVEGVSMRSSNGVLRLERDAWSMVK